MTPAQPALDAMMEGVTALLENVTPGPWSYRPREYDDWGVVRAPEANGRHPMICQARNPERLDDEVLSEHRISGIDPWGPNARFIAAARELVPALVAEVRAQGETIAGLEKRVEALTGLLRLANAAGSAGRDTLSGDTPND
jgi:hypothetical protein